MFHDTNMSDNNSGKSTKMKLKDLSVYGSPEIRTNISNQDSIPHAGQKPFTEEKFSVFREFVWQYIKPLQGFISKSVDVYGTGKAHTTNTIEYIQSDPAVLTRIGVISVATLGGVVAGFRGGRIRKLLYGTFTGLSVAAVCYPKEATQLGSKAGTMFKDEACHMWNSIYQNDAVKSTIDAYVKIPTKLPAESDKIIDPTLEDHGQSKVEDKDLYTTRTS